jgi:hypothetical protein
MPKLKPKPKQVLARLSASPNEVTAAIMECLTALVDNARSAPPSNILVQTLTHIVVCASHVHTFNIPSEFMLIIPPQMHSLTLVLLRRLCFALPNINLDQPPTLQRVLKHSLIRSAMSGAIEDLLFHSFMHEFSTSVRSVFVKTITALATKMRRKVRPWLVLQPQAFGMTQNGNTIMGESVCRSLAGTRMLGVCWRIAFVKVLNGS